MEESNQNDHLNFLNFNQETQEIMKIFPTKFPKNPQIRQEMVFHKLRLSLKFPLFILGKKCHF